METEKPPSLFTKYLRITVLEGVTWLLQGWTFQSKKQKRSHNFPRNRSSAKSSENDSLLHCRDEKILDLRKFYEIREIVKDLTRIWSYFGIDVATRAHTKSETRLDRFFFGSAVQ